MKNDVKTITRTALIVGIFYGLLLTATAQFIFLTQSIPVGSVFFFVSGFLSGLVITYGSYFTKILFFKNARLPIIAGLITAVANLPIFNGTGMNVFGTLLGGFVFGFSILWFSMRVEESIFRGGR